MTLGSGKAKKNAGPRTVALGPADDDCQVPPVRARSSGCPRHRGAITWMTAHRGREIPGGGGCVNAAMRHRPNFPASPQGPGPRENVRDVEDLVVHVVHAAAH